MDARKGGRDSHSGMGVCLWVFARLAASPTAPNRLGSCNAACGRYRRGHENGSLGRGAGHPSAELSLGSRGVMNRRTLDDRTERKSVVRGTSGSERCNDRRLEVGNLTMPATAATQASGRKAGERWLFQ